MLIFERMKLLILLAIISHCLAMPTATSNATETLYKLMENIKDRLFSAQCVTDNPTNDPKMTMWTPQMECLWPKMHDMDHTVDEWVTMMGKTGCTVPHERLLNMLKRSMTERNNENDPIMNKFPKTECGMCGRRIQCCPANQFLVQSYRSIACESAPCQIEPMTMENWNYFREKHPKLNLPTVNEPCNFAAIMRETTIHSKVFPFMRTMYMQMVGSEIPTMNCEMVENKCACCCNGFIWRAGQCVPMETETMQVTTTMTEMTTNMMMTETITEGTTTMPAIEMKPEDTTVQTITMRPAPQTTTPKILLNEDNEEEEKEKERHDEKKKRRSTISEEDDDFEESMEAQAEEQVPERVVEEMEEESEEMAEMGAEDIASSQEETEVDPVGEAIPA